MSIGQIFLRNLAFWTRYSVKKKIIFISNKVYKDLKANKARWTSPMTKKIFDANELLCNNNMVKTHQVNRSDFKRRLGFVENIFRKKQLFLFPIKFVRMSRRIKKGEHCQWLLKLQTRMSSCVTTIATTRNHIFFNFKEWFIHDREHFIYDKIWYVSRAIFLLLEVRLISTSISIIELLFFLTILIFLQKSKHLTLQWPISPSFDSGQHLVRY